jgi:hypothetical protein
MRLSQKAIDEFRTIYKKEFGEEITDDEAQEMGQGLLRILDIIYRPLPKGHKCEACDRMNLEDPT